MGVFFSEVNKIYGHIVEDRYGMALLLTVKVYKAISYKIFGKGTIKYTNVLYAYSFDI